MTAADGASPSERDAGHRPRRSRSWRRLLLSFPLVSDDTYYQNMIILSLVFAIGASGLNIITGFAGYVSLGQGAFIGLGGYTVGVLADPSSDIVAVAVGAGGRPGRRRSVALGLGLVSLRSRGPAFVIITVAFLFLVQVCGQLGVAHRRHGRAHAAAARPGASTSSTGRSTTRWWRSWRSSC